MPRIAIPLPHSSNVEYAERAMPQYVRAVELAGGEAVRVALDLSPGEAQRIAESCDGVLLPGSNADVDPEKFHAERSLRTAAADLPREDADMMLLREAYARRKPVLGICYGLQSLNVFRSGSLIQHIPDFLPDSTKLLVNHEAGGKVAVAHSVEIDRDSRLAGIVESAGGRAAGSAASIVLPVNSSHHQSAENVGDGLRIVARCPDDGIVEAVEGTAADHFVVGVQWHPERSVDEDAASGGIFAALIEAAQNYRAHRTAPGRP